MAHSQRNLVPIDAHAFPPGASHVSGPISDQEAAAMFRAACQLFRHWGVTDAQAAVLLDVAPRTFVRWKAARQPSALDRDKKARLSNLMGIHKALRIVFREPERGYGWVARPNAAFAERTPLAVMLGGELTDLMRIRQHLDAERGA